jgi:hypothetical protein
MSDLTDPKTMLHKYLQDSREALLWKLDGLGERALRLPRTPTGTNLLGIVKHCANVEIGYFGPTFGRAWPAPDDPGFVPLEAYDTDPQADWVVDAETSADGIVSFYRQVWEFADEAIEQLPLDTLGHVPWWPVDRQDFTLRRALLHVADDLARHAGQADILRELADGAVGWKTHGSNVPEEVDWPAYVARLTDIAEQFPR